MNELNLMYQASLALQNLKSDTQLQKQLSQYGYDARRINEGVKLFEDAQSLNEQQEMALRQSEEAADSLLDTRKHIQERYMRHLAIARVTFIDDVAANKALGLEGKRERNMERWLKQTRDFYCNSSPYIKDLQTQGVPLHELDEIRILVGQMIDLAALQKQAQSRSQVLMQQKQETIVLLKGWYTRLIRVARLALEDNPRLLEAIGVALKA